MLKKITLAEAEKIQPGLIDSNDSEVHGYKIDLDKAELFVDDEYDIIVIKGKATVKEEETLKNYNEYRKAGNRGPIELHELAYEFDGLGWGPTEL